MKIAVVNNFYPPRVGGSSHLSDLLATRYQAAGHEVLVLTTSYGDAPSEEVRDGLRIVRIPARTLPSFGLSIDFDMSFVTGPRAMRRIRQLLDDFRPDVIHQHGQFFDLTWLTGWYARRNKIPTLLSVHTRLENPGVVYGTAFKALDRLLVRPILSTYRPDYVVMDRLMDEYIRARYGAAPDRLIPIPVGIEPGRFDDVDGDIVRESLGIGNRPMILSLGHVIPVRDRVDLVEALPALIRRQPDVVVVVVGEVHYSRFLDRAAELGVADRIICVGPQPKTAIPSYFAAADVEVHDLQGYGLGTASLEAMAAGVPIVVAVPDNHFPGLELIDGEVCLLTPLRDPQALAESIDRVLVDQPLRDKVGAAGREFVLDNFTIDRVARKHLDHFEKMVSGATSSTPRYAAVR